MFANEMLADANLRMSCEEGLDEIVKQSISRTM